VAGAVAGVAGVCAPAIKAMVIVAPAIACSMRFGFKYIGTVPPVKSLVGIRQGEFIKKTERAKHFIWPCATSSV
jgi:hypothetical protein